MNRRIEQRAGGGVQFEAARLRLDEDAGFDQVLQQALQRLGIRTRRLRELFDAGPAPSNPFSEAQRNGNADAPRRGEIGQRPDVDRILWRNRALRDRRQRAAEAGPASAFFRIAIWPEW